MEISSGQQDTAIQVEVMKKAQDVKEMQGQQDLKVMESASEQSKEMTAQKTGVGGNLNIIG